MDEAFQWLDHPKRHAWLPWFRVIRWPGCEALRKDPRMAEHLRRMNLPPLEPPPKKLGGLGLHFDLASGKVGLVLRIQIKKQQLIYTRKNSWKQLDTKIIEYFFPRPRIWFEKSGYGQAIGGAGTVLPWIAAPHSWGACPHSG
jgi:hypothetical protein